MSWIRRNFRTFAAIHRWWREQLSAVAKCLVIMLLVSWPSLADPDSPVAIGWATIFLLLLFSNLFQRIFRPRLRASVELPSDWKSGEQKSVTIVVAQTGFLPTFDATLKPSSNRLWASDGRSASLSMLSPQCEQTLLLTLTPLRRGIHLFPEIKQETLFPLGIARRSWDLRVKQDVTVLPSYHSLTPEERAALGSSLGEDNEVSRPKVGASGEYVGSREYVPGMLVRRWDYKSWARIGQPVIREYAEPQGKRITIIIDNEVLEHHEEVDGQVAEVEAVISMAAAIGEALLNSGHSVVLRCASNVRPTVSSTATDSLSEWLHQLAAVIPARTQQSARSGDRNDGNWQESSAYRESMLFVSTRGNLPAFQSANRATMPNTMIGLALVSLQSGKPPTVSFESPMAPERRDRKESLWS